VTRRLAQRFVVAIFMAALLLAPLVSQAPIAASDNASGYHWARQSSQFTLQVGSNLDGPWPGILGKAVADWNKSQTVTFLVVAGGTNPQVCNPVTGRVEVCNWRYGTQEGWLGLTRLYFNDRGDHIEAATVQMNDSFFDTARQSNNENARRHTMCHEMGHTTGLDHDSTSSCMNDSQDAVFNNVMPTKKNFNQLERIHAHSDSTTTVAGAQKKEKKDKKKKKKSEKNHGKRHGKRQGAARSETVTVESTEDGRKVVTFITLAGG
jgi:hypothetical protein